MVISGGARWDNLARPPAAVSLFRQMRREWCKTKSNRSLVCCGKTRTFWPSIHHRGVIIIITLMSELQLKCCMRKILSQLSNHLLKIWNSNYVLLLFVKMHFSSNLSRLHGFIQVLCALIRPHMHVNTECVLSCVKLCFHPFSVNWHLLKLGSYGSLSQQSLGKRDRSNETGH